MADDLSSQECQTTDKVEQTSVRKGKKRRGRGPTTMPDLIIKRVKGEKMSVSFNAKGRPVGPGSVKMESAIGTLVRTLVPISLKSWREVTDDQKKNIWDSLLVNFDLPPTAQNLIYQSASMKYRDFKGRLHRKYVAPFGEDITRYARPPAIYKGFISQEDWDEFVRQRRTPEFKAASELQRQRRSKSKYNYKLSRKGYANLERDLISKSGSGNGITRAKLWKIAHASKSGECADDETSSMIKKIDECESLMAGKNTDVMGMAFGELEHTRLVRGVECNVSINKPIHTSRSSISRLKQSHETELKAQQENFEKKLAVQSQKHEAETNRLEQELAEQRAESNDMKGRVAMLEQKIALLLEGPHSRTLESQDSCTRASNDKEEAPKVEDPLPSGQSSLHTFAKYSADYLPHDKIIQIVFREGLFHRTSYTFIGHDEAKDIIELKELGTSHIVMWMSYLYSKMQEDVELKDKFKFINPALISAKAGNLNSRINHMKEALMHGGTVGQKFLAPYNAGQHWILLLITPQTKSVVYMDPLHRYEKEDLKSLLKGVFDTPKGPNIHRLRTLPRQPQSWECGYYVSLFMSDLIDRSDQHWGTKKSYTKEDIDQFRMQWCSYVLRCKDMEKENDHAVHL